MTRASAPLPTTAVVTALGAARLASAAPRPAAALALVVRFGGPRIDRPQSAAGRPLPERAPPV